MSEPVVPQPKRWAILSDDILRLLTAFHWLIAWFLATQPSLIPWVMPWAGMFALAGATCLLASYRRTPRTVALAGAMTVAAYASRALSVIVAISYTGVKTPGAYVGITAWVTMAVYAWRLFVHAHRER